MALFSLKRAQQRLLSAKRKRENPDEDEDAERRDAEQQAATFVNQASEIGDDRPLTCCEFSPQGLSFASASAAGTVKLWDVPGLNKTLTIKAHDARVTGALLIPYSLCALRPGYTTCLVKCFLVESFSICSCHVLANGNTVVGVT